MNEGICTYVGYRALPIFPVEDERDYRMLEDENEVCRLLADTNVVLSQYGKLSGEELQKLFWDKGIMERAYYVTGAYMCKVIDEKESRDALIHVYSQGLISIIERYNKNADGNLKIALPS